MHRVAIVTSHPIQYQAPLFRALAAVTDLEVFFAHRIDGAGQAAAGFDVEFDWDVDLLDGYRHSWLSNRSRRPNVFEFSGCDTPEIGDRLGAGRFDACLVFGWYLRTYLQAIFASRRRRIPVLVRGDSHLGTARSNLVRLVKYVPYRWLLTRVDAHLYVGSANRDYLAHYGVEPSRLFFAPHFVDNNFFAVRAAAARRDGHAAAVRNGLGIPSDASVFAWVGKLVENKRPADFVRAVAAARQTGADVHGLVIGSGPLAAELEQLAAALDSPVRFAGFRNQSELPHYLAAADALVLSSASETWGLVVNEAMACGLPAVVSSAAGCARDLIEPGRTGYQYPAGNVDALASAMTALRGVVARDARRVREHVDATISRYSCEAAVSGTLAAVDAVVASRRCRKIASSRTSTAAAS